MNYGENIFYYDMEQHCCSNKMGIEKPDLCIVTSILG